MVGAIIGRNFATLKELQTFYSYDDGIDLFEAIQVINYNEWVIKKRYEKR
jgi:hypothetical protein